jgi:hypothetical protein
MFERHIQQLQDPNSAKRREAIIALGKLGDTRAIKPLASLYKSESDPALRDLVAKAGKHLQALEKQKMAAPPPAAPPVAPPVSAPPPAVIETYDLYEDLPTDDMIYTSIDEPELEPAPPPKPVVPGFAPKPSAPESSPVMAGPVSESKRKQARTKLANAFRYKTVQDDDNAIIELGRALELDPELALDGSAKNLATALVGGSSAEAIRAVQAQGKIVAAQKKTKPKQKDADEGEVTDLVVSGVILMVVLFVFSAALVYSIIIIAAYTLTFLYSEGLLENNYYVRLLGELPFRVLLPDILRSAIVLFVTTMFQVVIIYFVGSLMGGVAAFGKFAKALLVQLALFYVVLTFAFAFMVAGALSGSLETFGTLFQASWALLVLASLGGLISQSVAVGRVQKFGAVKGFLSILGGAILAAVLSSVLGLFRVSTSFNFDEPLVWLHSLFTLY